MIIKFDTVAKVQDLAIQFNGVSGTDLGKFQRWHFPNQRKMWQFAGAIRIFDENSCIDSMTEKTSDCIVEILYQ